MSRESILKIRETEDEAERIVAEARARAHEMILEAEQKGRDLCRRAEDETAAEMRAMLDQIRERTASVAARMAEENVADSEEMRNTVALRRRVAEKIIVRGFEAKCR